MLEVLDLVLAPVYIFLFLFVAILYRSRDTTPHHLKKFFLSGLLIKFFGAIAAGLIYEYYYGTGDTFIYFDAARYMNSLLDINPEHWFQAMTHKAQGNVATRYFDIRVVRYDQTFFFVKICSLLGLLSLNTYMVIALFLACYSFYSSWYFYKMACDIYPTLYKTFGYIIFYIPSVTFWGSGLFKDTITYSGVIMLTASFYFIFIKKQNIFKNIVIFSINFYLVYNIREFLILAVIPPLIIWYVLSFKNLIRNVKVKFFIGPILMLISVLGGSVAISSLSGADEALQKGNLQDKAKGFQSWHSIAGGSSYSLGDVDYSSNFTLLQKAPLAINVTLFRPYLWEVNNPVMLIAAFESLFFLILLLGVLKDVKLKFFYYFFDNNNAFFFLLFSLMYAFITGFTSYNFGALGRYKIPCMPYFLLGIYMIKNEITKQKVAQEAERVLKKQEEIEQKRKERELDMALQQ